MSRSTPCSSKTRTSFEYASVMLSAWMESRVGMFTTYGCGGTKSSSRETGFASDSSTLRMPRYSTRSSLCRTQPKTISSDWKAKECPFPITGGLRPGSLLPDRGQAATSRHRGRHAAASARERDTGQRRAANSRWQMAADVATLTAGPDLPDLGPRRRRNRKKAPATANALSRNVPAEKSTGRKRASLS